MSVLKYTAAGILLGLLLVMNAALLNYKNGFRGPWFHIFDYSPDFVVILLSPVILGLLFCFIGIRWQQLVTFNKLIKRDLSNEQMIVSMADQQLKLLGKVVSQINEAVIITDIKGGVVWANDGFTKISGYSSDDVKGKNPNNFLITPHSNGEPVNTSGQNIFRGESLVEEVLHYKKDGSTYWALISVKPIYDDAGKITNYIAIESDISGLKEKFALENEIAERIELEKQLLANKNKLEQAMEIARFGAWEIDVITKSLSLSKELRTICNMPLTGDITKSELVSHIHSDDLRNILMAIKIAEKIGRAEIEYRYIINGEVRHMISNMAPRFDESGKLTGFVGTVMDVTQRKLFELALKKSEEEKAAVLNNAQTVICLHDLNGVILDVNPAAEKLTGYSKQELVGTNLMLLLCEDFHQHFGNYLDQIVNKKAANGSFIISTKTGKRRTWLYQNTLYDNKDGKPYVIASAIDITDSLKAQNEIEKQQQFINEIIDNSPNMIFVINEKREVVLWNKTFGKYYKQSNKISSFAPDLSKGPDDIFLGDIESMMDLEDGEMIRLEGSIEEDDKSTKWFNVIKKCFKDKHGRKYFLAIGMDITGRYQIETDLIAANEMVERSLKVKDQFISNMSHEIRTPLNAVIGFTDLLADTPLNKEQDEYVHIVKSASQNLLALINNILDLSKIESGNLALEVMPLDLKQIVTDAVKILEPKAKIKGIELRKNLAENIPHKLMGDQLRLSQIIFNLMGNAVKFTDTGYVEIGCKLVGGPDDEKQYISFWVRDTGIGVPEEKQQLIFERFTQATISTERLYGGTGLGLNIAKGIVDMHGGTLKMESTPGKGTEFHFILPFQKYEGVGSLDNGSGEEASYLPLPADNDIKVLLTEDNEINALLATQVLENGGFTVKHVVNGVEAVAAVQQEHFDIVLMDIQMPLMNGIEATKCIRELEGEVSKIPIVAMTAHSLYGEMQNCYNAGMTGYVSKPFKPENLFSAIMESIKVQRSGKKITHTINDMVAYT